MQQRNLNKILRLAVRVFYVITLATPIFISSCTTDYSAVEPDRVVVENQLPEGHNVAFTASSSAQSRTTIDEDDLSTIYWSQGDQVALWAKSQSTDFLTLTAAEFTMLYHATLDYTEAVFTGEVEPLEEGTYTYYATYPLPKSVSELTATLEIPSTQSGYYDGTADLMVAKGEVGDAMGKDARLNTSLSFSHLLHALRIEIPETRDGLGTTTKLEIFFPTDVVGDLVVDMSGSEVTTTLTESSNTILVDFDQVISQAGYVWVFINPTTITGDIEFIGYDSEGAPSEYIFTTLNGREMAAGKITPITLTIPVEQPRRVVLNQAENYLGEDPTSVTLTAPSGAYFYIDDDTEASTLTLTPDSDGTYEFYYYASLYDTAFRSEPISVKLVSEHASLDGNPIELGEEHSLANNYISYDVPYLLFEDFSGISASASGSSTVSVPGCTYSWTIGKYYQYWEGACVAIKAYRSGMFSTRTESSLTLSKIPALTSSASITITFDAAWSNSACSSMKISVGGSSQSLTSNSLASESNMTSSDLTTNLSNIGTSSSIAWTSSTSNSLFTASTETIYIDNIRISIQQ